MVFASVRRDNPRTLASGLSTAQADKPCPSSLESYYPVQSFVSQEMVTISL